MTINVTLPPLASRAVAAFAAAVLAAVMPGFAAPAFGDSAPAPERPRFAIETEQAYDPSAVPAYPGEHAAIYARIDESIDDHIAALQRWMRQPSISAQDQGIAEMAEMLRGDLQAIGFQEAELVPTDGHPGVWGYYDAGAERTLLVYMMYDVQPVNPEDWDSPPFAADLVENELGRVIMARGATNQKGPERAFLNALEAIIAVEGTLPVNVMIAAEGEEELGSPNYPQIVDAYEERMRQAHGVLFPMSVQSPDGDASMLLGVKGILYFEMEARGGEWGGPQHAEIHGSYKAIVDSPTLRLVQALASLTSADGNTILVPGYYDGIRPPTDEEQRLINGAAGQRDEEQLLQAAGVARFSRLPVGIDPDEALAKIRAHLDANGFGEITIRKLSGYPAAQTSVGSDLAQAVISVYNKHLGNHLASQRPAGKAGALSIQPRIAGSAPFYQFTERLGLPLVPAGLGHGRGAHAPNEIYLVEPAPGVPIAGLAGIEKAYVDLLYAVAGK
ncbi:MAG: M20/M25/M40 family metallo-hydrolase [Xanthomonadales bacterium]|nr:M20/M25/M40 family metallo-hydrolase [Xanthomonadales bacterium]